MTYKTKHFLSLSFIFRSCLHILFTFYVILGGYERSTKNIFYFTVSCSWLSGNMAGANLTSTLQKCYNPLRSSIILILICVTPARLLILPTWLILLSLKIEAGLFYFFQLFAVSHTTEGKYKENFVCRYL